MRAASIAAGHEVMRVAGGTRVLRTSESSKQEPAMELPADLRRRWDFKVVPNRNEPFAVLASDYPTEDASARAPWFTGGIDPAGLLPFDIHCGDIGPEEADAAAEQL